MRIHITCDCGIQLDVQDTLAGQKITCHSCGRQIAVPGLAPSAPAGGTVAHDRPAALPAGTPAGWYIAAAFLVTGAVKCTMDYFRYPSYWEAVPMLPLVIGLICVILAAGLCFRMDAVKWTTLVLLAIGSACCIAVAFDPVSRFSFKKAIFICSTLTIVVGFLCLLDKRSTMVNALLGTILVIAGSAGITLLAPIVVRL